ncbi:MAG: SpoIID/LytB domain-containing protein [Longimicrobiales bacterium]|nr:SpoIID/LytB domain-containing protein [Longimicrobiales bacterium]
MAGRPITEPPATPVDVPPAEAVRGASPEVRVGVAVDEPSIRVATDRGAELTDPGGRVWDRGSGPWVVTRSGSGVEVRDGGRSIRLRGGVVVRSRDGRVRVNGTAYRGAVLIRAAATGVTAVNLLDLETYLRGVVPLEIGAGRPPEALEAVKAQAVAARTYAIRHLGRRDALGFDYYGTVADQVYGGADAEDPVSTRAVEETRGQILTYDGEPIEAYYHSTCGGRTAALEEVWRGAPRPYLRSVSDRRPDGGWYCEASNRFRWTEAWSEADLLEALTVGLRDRGLGTIGEVRSIEVRGRTSSGRAAELEVRTDRGVARVHGDSIRRVLAPEPGRILNSTAIELEPEAGSRVTALTVHGSGWGHGIGMCQMGALGRAAAGAAYRDILSTYYPGTRLVRLYR